MITGHANESSGRSFSFKSITHTNTHTHTPHHSKFGRTRLEPRHVVLHSIKTASEAAQHYIYRYILYQSYFVKWIEIWRTTSDVLVLYIQVCAYFKNKRIGRKKNRGFRETVHSINIYKFFPEAMQSLFNEHIFVNMNIYTINKFYIHNYLHRRCRRNNRIIIHLRDRLESGVLSVYGISTPFHNRYWRKKRKKIY